VTVSQDCGPTARHPALIRSNRFVDYVTARLIEDPHLWARTLFD
jgi:hypothetical protein